MMRFQFPVSVRSWPWFALFVALLSAGLVSGLVSGVRGLALLGWCFIFFVLGDFVIGFLLFVSRVFVWKGFKRGGDG